MSMAATSEATSTLDHTLDPCQVPGGFPAQRPTSPDMAADQLNEHLRDMMAWHFSPETGCEFWLTWAKENNFDALTEVKTIDDIVKFPHFEDDWLRFEPHHRFIPKAYDGRPFTIFETGGTTGMPKQRIGWDDYKIDYSFFSQGLKEEAFPPGGFWLMIGPTGPRRLRLAIEHLAHVRKSSCYFVDLDPRYVKKLIKRQKFDEARIYMEHVIEQAVIILKHRQVNAVFTTPKLLEALAERVSIPGSGIKGVFVGGTTIDRQYARFLVEEVLENQTEFVPTYGNTLMGLAAHKHGFENEEYSISYYSPQPRAVLRVVNPDSEDCRELVNYDEVGRVELTTLTRELFLPRFLERDEAFRRRPCKQYPWDGVGEVRPFGQSKQKIVEGVY